MKIPHKREHKRVRKLKMMRSKKYMGERQNDGSQNTKV